MVSITPPTAAEIDIGALTARLKLLEEENRRLKAQLFGRSSEKTLREDSPRRLSEKTLREDLHPSQAWLVNETESLAAADTAPASVTIHAHRRLKHGRKRLDPALPRVDVVHDISDAEKRCVTDGATLERIGEEISEQHRWLQVLAPQVVPQSRLGRAVHYTLGQRPKLIVFLNHGEVPLDNNRCENAIRALVVGRKGWLFSDTVADAKPSANLFSLVETCKANSIEPHAYLSRLFVCLPHLRTVDDFESLVPWNVESSWTNAPLNS